MTTPSALQSAKYVFRTLKSYITRLQMIQPLVPMQCGMHKFSPRTPSFTTVVWPGEYLELDIPLTWVMIVHWDFTTYRHPYLKVSNNLPTFSLSPKSWTSTPLTSQNPLVTSSTSARTSSYCKHWPSTAPSAQRAHPGVLAQPTCRATSKVRWTWAGQGLPLPWGSWHNRRVP